MYEFGKLRRLLVNTGLGAAGLQPMAGCHRSCIEGMCADPWSKPWAAGPKASAASLASQVRTRLQLQDTLRDLALASTERLLEFVRSACPASVAVHSTATVELASTCIHQQPPPTQQQQQQQQQARRAVPLLSNELVISADGASVAYASGADAMRERVLAAFDRGLQRLQVGTRACAAGQRPLGPAEALLYLEIRHAPRLCPRQKEERLLTPCRPSQRLHRACRTLSRL